MLKTIYKSTDKSHTDLIMVKAGMNCQGCHYNDLHLKTRESKSQICPFSKNDKLKCMKRVFGKLVSFHFVKAFPILLMLITLNCTAQTKNALSISYQPADHGTGIRYNVTFNDVIGAYTSVSYGDFGVYRQYGIREHVKLTVGVMSLFTKELDYDFSTDKPTGTRKYYITAGINYHYLGYTTDQSALLNSKIFNPWSFELGVTAYIWRHFVVGMRTDILRWEPCVDFGYLF